jgi:hypothetical protein
MYRSLKHYKLLKSIIRKPIEKTFPSYKIFQPNIFHEIDILYMSQYNGYKYILSLIDVHNSIVGIRALKDIKMLNVINATDDIYRKSKYLRYPQVIQGDSGFNNTPFKEYCNENDIELKISAPYNSRQNAHVERLNNQIKYIISMYSLNDILDGNKKNMFNWVALIPEIEKYINKYRTKKLDKRLRNDKLDDIPDNNDKTPSNNTIYSIGSIVYLENKFPVDLITGKTAVKNKKRRIGDMLFDITKKYEIIDHYFMNDVILYKIKNIKNNKILPALYTKERLKLVV